MMKPWMRWNYIKEGFISLFWGFHYILLFGLLTSILCIGVFTSGSAIMAMCSCTRRMAKDEGVSLSIYFKL